MANINDFKTKLAGGGARKNQFKVTMPFPGYAQVGGCLLYTSPSPRDRISSRMPSSA